MILAYAGVHRLGLDAHIRQVIPVEIMLPAVGQGVMAIEVRENDVQAAALIEKFNDRSAAACVTAERAFLRSLEGGCQVPIGAYAFLENDKIHLEGVVGSLNGSVNLRDKITGEIKDAEHLGRLLADILIGAGANEILERTREKVENLKEEVL
jgi:hydroxymethylbilane synthase